MAMGIDYYSYPTHKTGLPWGSDTKPGAGGAGAAGGGGGTQGLAHWMSMMAEHMNHESASSLHPAYMWHNGIDQKMSLSEQQLLQKGEAGGYYGAGRGESPGSASPPSSGSVVVPQPINVAKMSGSGGGLHSHSQHSHQPVRKYQCKMCPQIFASKADLQLHTQIHMREPKPYKCASCNKAFANSSYLSQHTRIHLGIKPYRCEICQRKFTQLSHLQQHIRTHTGDKPYKCRIPGCTKAFSQLSNLQSHSRCHQTDKPYKCNSCYKCFHDEQALLEHIPKHKESKHLKTHICSYCGKSYTQETYLAKHMQKHSDRSDKRPPIVASGTSTTPVSSMHHISGLGGSPTDHYWPKMDAYGYGHQLMDQRLHDPRDYDPRSLAAVSNSQAASLHQGLMQGAEELRHHSSSTGSAQLSSSWGEHSSPSPHSSSKAGSSAFSPLQSAAAAGMSPAGFGMPAHRGYPSFYDPISFAAQTQSQKLSFGDAGAVGGAATNSTFSGPQLLSLSKIKSYAHNPQNDGFFKSLSSLAGDKGAMGQLGAAQ